MKEKSFKVYFSAIVGVATAIGYGIVNNSQANGVGQDFIVKIGILAIWTARLIAPFIITFFASFAIMLIWQKVHHQSFMSARAKFFSWWDKMVKGFYSLVED